MPEINLSNSAGRDAVVTTEGVLPTRTIRWVDDRQRQANGIRVIKSTTDHDIDALIQSAGDLSAVSQFLMEGDPEIDFENTGRLLKDTSRVYVDKNHGIVRNVRFLEVVHNADGSVREERVRSLAGANVSSDSPLRWSGTYIPKEKAIRKFVFSSKMQLHHVNGLTFDFLFSMAEELEKRGSLMLLGAGPKSNQPLVLRRGGNPYRGFLEGRTDGDRYCLLLHLSNLELKKPAPQETEEDES
ncbi:MAG: hypothetical protein AAGG48_08635 [Planctomycetota bacterium]